LDDLSCTGTEKNLALCGHRGWGKNNCDHTEDASVICVGKFDLVGVKMLYREEIETVSVQIYKYKLYYLDPSIYFYTIAKI
jgi:hypothetical protein